MERGGSIAAMSPERSPACAGHWLPSSSGPLWLANCARCPVPVLVRAQPTAPGHVGEVSDATERWIYAAVGYEEAFKAESPDAASLGLIDQLSGRVDLDERVASTVYDRIRTRPSESVLQVS
jgi:hypothetical protein